jgi:hypothetical protein
MQLSFLLHTRVGKVFCAGNAATEKPGVLMDLPVALHLLDLNRLRLKVDPLNSAQPRQSSPSHAVTDLRRFEVVKTMKPLEQMTD